MQINIVSVAVSKIKTYQQAEIVYTANGQTGTKKLMSFANPATFATLKDAKAGDAFEITQVKNDKGYWDWTSATSVAAAAASAGVASKAAWVPDADRQRLIVKQSSLTAALKYFELQGNQPDYDQVVTLADDFVAYVYDVEQPAIEEVA